MPTSCNIEPFFAIIDEEHIRIDAVDANAKIVSSIVVAYDVIVAVQRILVIFIEIFTIKQCTLKL